MTFVARSDQSMERIASLSGLQNRLFGNDSTQSIEKAALPSGMLV